MGLKIVGACTPFADRADAARLLGDALAAKPPENPLILAIPRGGVLIGAILAQRLSAELDIVLTRKLGSPGNPELAIGAVMEEGQTFLNQAIIAGLDIPQSYIEHEKSDQLRLLHERARLYREARPFIPREGRNLIIVDDGVATGATMLATLNGLRACNPASILCALPVGPEETLGQLAGAADVVCLACPSWFQAVGQFYDRFTQVSDAEVIETLRKSASRKGNQHADVP